MTDAAQWPWAGLAAALGSGLLIGIERERRKGTGPARAFAGVRTFTLTAVAGAGAMLSGVTWLVVAGALLTAVLAALGQYRDRSGDPGATTEIALFLTYVLGVLSIERPALVAGIAVIVTVLLAGRGAIHRFAVQALSPQEMRDGLLFCGAALVLLPLLPEHIGNWLPNVNPRRLWGLVVLFMGLQAAGYVAVRVAGGKVGLTVSGLAGGFVSSTATIAALGTRARGNPALLPACVAGAFSSTLATVVLLAVVAATVYPPSLRALGAGLLASAAVAAAAIWWFLRSANGLDDAALSRGRAFSLRHALGFAVLLSGGAAAMGLLAQRWGDKALTAATTFAGFFDVHAAAASALSVVSGQSLTPRELSTVVWLAFSTNTLSKVAAAFVGGGRDYGLRVATGLVAVAASAWVMMRIAF